ncbi:hypothetical protein M3Y99_01396200 [Aphelenchoides fujianensis]|nr:hypothetical protein M3Y99_01396200 [Aphelenchoides fujianensis]
MPNESIKRVFVRKNTGFKRIAYSVLAGLPPATGLYTTFFGAFAYPLVSSWPHGSMAPFAIIELMCGTAADSVIDDLFIKNYSRQFTYEQLLQINPSTIVSTLTFMVGIICFFFALLRVQFLAQYFSEPLVSGFVTAAAIHVLFSQLDSMFGFKKPKSGGFGYMFREIAEIFLMLPRTNLMTLCISVLSFLFLCLTKCYLYDHLSKWAGRKLMIPYELLLVMSTTACVHFLHLDSIYGVTTVGEIPRGIPAPQMPKTFLIRPLFWDAVAVAVVYVALHLSIAKVMCLRQNYKVDENQELYAVGIRGSAGRCCSPSAGPRARLLVIQIQRTFIFDCSGITDVDTVGLNAFGQVVKELRQNDVDVYFSGCPQTLIPQLQEANAWQSEKEVFPNVHDATLNARLKQGGIGTTSSLDPNNPRRCASVQYSV